MRREFDDFLVVPLQSSCDQASIHEVEKSTQLYKVIAHFGQRKAIAIKFRLKMIYKQLIASKRRQTNFENVALHTVSML